MLKYRKITEADDESIAVIIRENLKRAHLDIPGTVYFDPELDHLSAYYNSDGKKRVYFIALDESGQVAGGIGISELKGVSDWAELQKLYLNDAAKGKGHSKELVYLAENWARENGYKKLYLETHSNFKIAIKLYEKLGFQRLERPKFVVHSTMDHFYQKDL